MTTQHRRITRTAAALPCAIAVALIVTVSLPGASGVDPLGFVATGLAQTKPQQTPAPQAKAPAPQAKAPAQAKAPQAAAPQTKTATPAQVSTQGQPLNPVGGQKD